MPLAIEALDAGFHVVVDKPLAASAADAAGVIATARARGRLLTVFQNRRWDGDFLTLRRLVHDGRLGRVFRFESHFDRWRPDVKPGWRMSDAPEEAGGLLFDRQPPHRSGARAVRPGDARLRRARPRRPGVSVDDDSFVALKHASGVRSHLSMGALVAQLGPRFRVLGDRAGYTKFGLDVQEERLRGGADPSVSGWSDEAPDQWGRVGTDERSEPVRTEPGAYAEFYRLLVESLRTGGPLPVDPEDAVATLTVVEAAQRSAARAEVVAL